MIIEMLGGGGERVEGGIQNDLREKWDRKPRKEQERERERGKKRHTNSSIALLHPIRVPKLP